MEWEGGAIGGGEREGSEGESDFPNFGCNTHVSRGGTRNVVFSLLIFLDFPETNNETSSDFVPFLLFWRRPTCNFDDLT